MKAKHNSHCFNGIRFSDITRIKILRMRPGLNKLNKIDYLRSRSLIDEILRPKLVMFIASFFTNDLGHTPKTIKKSLLEFFPEMITFFEEFERLYPA